ncbi:MAG TPA: LysM domain-containing protein [Desulfosporosinus sp.]|nr:LysM domain-containing protein [Desulfosporosinus sp.]
MGKEYCIQPGDNFHALAQRWGGTCDDFLQVNPYVDPLRLQVGQKIVLPDFKGSTTGQAQYAEIRVDHGQEFVGEYLDQVEMEVEGVSFRVRRIGEPKVPHEIHLILPRAEIRKLQPAGDGGPCEVQIMLSNMDIVLSPRLVSGKGDREPAKPMGQVPTQAEAQTQPPQLSQTLQQSQVQQLPQVQSLQT